jgi:hypothetical protein
MHSKQEIIMMFSFSKSNLLLGYIVLGLSVSTYAEDLKLWQVSEKAPAFYQEPVETSQKLPALKPGQTMVILKQQKDWVKVANLGNGDTGWVAGDQVQPDATVNLMINKTPHAYHYQMGMQDTSGQQMGTWKIMGSVFEGKTQPVKKTLKEKLGFKKKTSINPNNIEDFNEIMRKEFEMMEKNFSILNRGFIFPVIQPVVVVANDKAQAIQKKTSTEVKHLEKDSVKK